MSTRAIRKIIEAHRALGPTVRGTPAHDLHLALDEVEAIEKAAGVAHRLGLHVEPASLDVDADYVGRMEARHRAVYLFADIERATRERQRNGGTIGAPSTAGASGPQE